MSCFLIPIVNLVLQQNLIFKDTIIIPVYNDKQFKECEESHPEIYSIIENNQDFYMQCCDNLLNIAVVDSPMSSPCNTDFEIAIDTVNRALDYIRYNSCRIDLRETLPGLPGIVENQRYLFFYNSENDTLIKHTLSPYLYSLQPGIGLDLGYLNDYKNENTYKVFNSPRTDEVYLEYRSILSRACFAFHITDLNRCFCYLFSTVERMGGQTYMQFQKRKKRIISFISRDQQQYDSLNNQFYFYSKWVRTEIVHKGKKLSDMLPLRDINNLLNNLILLIYRFCETVILSGITSISELENHFDQKVLEFNYTVPDSSNDNTTIPDMGFLDSGKHTFFTGVPNLEIPFTIKQGNVIYLPCNSVFNWNKYYWNYVYLDLWEEYHSDENKNLIIQLDDTELLLDAEFFTFTAYDLDTVLNTIKFPEAQEINKHETLAIIIDEPFLNDPTWSFKSYSAFADIICNKINHSLDYLILSKLNINQRDHLPSLSGITNSIRAAYRVSDIENTVHPIPGKVYSQYCFPQTPFVIEPDFQIDDVLLFNTLFNDREDEIALLCKNALSQIVDCYYISDPTIQISYMFDILDMLDPTSTEGDKLKSYILPLIATGKQDYHNKCHEFKDLRDLYRNSLLHLGKSIYDLTCNQTEIYDIFNVLEHTIVSFCKIAFDSNAETFDDLKQIIKTAKTNLGIL